MTPILETVGLAKDFRHQWTMRRIKVLRKLDLHIEAGEIFGLIGPNGAGKTTTFKLLLGLLRPSGGTVRFEGRPLDLAARAAIGFLPEQPYFYDYLSIEETLHLFAHLYGLPGAERRRRVTEVIGQVGLEHKRRSALHTLSKGTLQRLGIAQAIIHRPRLLVLDEPMSGLDPLGRRHMRELILDLRRQGTAVIFSSHILPDAEVLCDRVGILVDGRLRDIVTVDREEQPQAYRLTVSSMPAEGLAAIERVAGASALRKNNQWQLEVRDPKLLGDLFNLVQRANGIIDGLAPVHVSLEERFLRHADPAGGLD
jgi:ABC-2 type transport system ATP-binding protein